MDRLNRLTFAEEPMESLPASLSAADSVVVSSMAMAIMSACRWGGALEVVANNNALLACSPAP
jgi:hypothetical protein